MLMCRPNRARRKRAAADLMAAMELCIGGLTMDAKPRAASGQPVVRQGCPFRITPSDMTVPKEAGGSHAKVPTYIE